MHMRNARDDIYVAHEATGVITASVQLNSSLDRYLSLLSGDLKAAVDAITLIRLHVSDFSVRCPVTVLKTVGVAFSSFAAEWPEQSRRRLVLPRG